MKQQKKLAWIKKVSPFIYDVGLALVCVYIGVRVRAWLNLFLPFESGLITAAVLIAYYALNLHVVKRNLVGTTRWMTYITGASTFVVMYLSMAMLVVDILQLVIGLFVPDLHIRHIIFFWSGLLCLVFVIAAYAVGSYKAARIVTVTEEISCPKLAKDYRIVLLSDLHIGFFVSTQHIKKVVEQVNSLNADMIVISGDIINAGNTNECPELREVALELARMKSRDGVFAVTGNHDPDAGESDFKRFLRKSNIKLLDDACYCGDLISVVGRRTRTKPRKPLSVLMAEADPCKPVLVLDHDPIGIPEAVQQNAELIMCGHTHKGQVFPLNLFVRFLYSRKQLWGTTKQGNTTSIVTAGTGYFSMPMRIGSDCEVVCTDFKSGTPEQTNS